MARHFEVWLLGAHMGTLSQGDGRLSFAYVPNASTPLSQALLPGLLEILTLSLISIKS